MQRQNLVYTLILGFLCVALAVVGILLLRRRALAPRPSVSSTSRIQKTVAPPAARSLDSYTPEPPFKPGDPPIPHDQESVGGGENTQP